MWKIICVEFFFRVQLQVKRSSSCTQVGEIQQRFIQRRHSLTSISGKGSPIEDKKLRTPWKMVRSIIAPSKTEPLKKKSLPSQPVKKPSLIEIAREQDPFLGIWMGPPEKMLQDPDSPSLKNPRSKSFEVPSSSQAELLNQRKIARGASYSPKTSVSSKISQNVTPNPEPTSKWSRVRNALLSREDVNLPSLDDNSNVSSPVSPQRTSGLFFADEESLKLSKGTLSGQ